MKEWRRSGSVGGRAESLVDRRQIGSVRKEGRYLRCIVQSRYGWLHLRGFDPSLGELLRNEAFFL